MPKGPNWKAVNEAKRICKKNRNPANKHRDAFCEKFYHGEKIGTYTVKLKAKLVNYNRLMRKVRRLKLLLLQVASLHEEINENKITIDICKERKTK